MGLSKIHPATTPPDKSPPQLPPIIAAIIRVAIVGAPIVGRAFMDAYKQAMISTVGRRPRGVGYLSKDFLVLNLNGSDVKIVRIVQ